MEIKQRSEKSEAFSIIFKAYTAVVVMHFAYQDVHSAMRDFAHMLDIVREIPLNDASKGLDTVLSAASRADFDTFDRSYQLVREKLALIPGAKTLIHKFDIRQCNDLILSNVHDRALRALDLVHANCQTANGQDDVKQYSSELTQIYALKTQIAFAQNSPVEVLNDLYNRSKDLCAPVKESQYQAWLEELWGRHQANENEWDSAYNHFQNSFSEYACQHDDQGYFKLKATQNLKYLIIANVALEGKRNPFQAPAARQLRNEKGIQVFNSLSEAFDKNDVKEFKNNLTEIKNEGDRFIFEHLQKVEWDFHRKAILDFVRSYRKIKITLLAENIEIDRDRCQKLVNYFSLHQFECAL